MFFDKWMEKDNLDQALHGLAGFTISLVPLLVVKYLFGMDVLIVSILLSAFSCVASILFGFAREYFQHKRIVFNLDLIFWIMGALVGYVTTWAILLLL